VIFYNNYIKIHEKKVLVRTLKYEDLEN